MANITAILLFIRSRDKQLSKNPPFAFMYVHVLEQFLIECCKTKTKVWVITPANHKNLDNTVNQSELTVIMWSWRKVWENDCEWVTIGFGFSCDWMKKWCEANLVA